MSWRPWLLVAEIGAVVVLAGIVSQIVQLVVSIRNREALRVSNDPWNARTLEWSVPSPPPAWNYAVLPHVSGRDAFWATKKLAPATRTQPAQPRVYEPIEMPRNSGTGFVSAFFAVITGFALIWHIWWLAALGGFGAFVTLLVFAFRDKEEFEVPAAEIARFYRDHPAEVVA
jgi:cytochrome o ubiquinol oxidase subunit 1